MTALLAVLATAGSVRPARAQPFLSPFVGYNFGGSSGCPGITNCQDKRINYGVAVGATGRIVGMEAELAYTDNFFGEASEQSSNVLTVMGNLMLAPKIGPVQPYALVGLGLIRTTVETAGTGNSQDQFGWDVGGGLTIFFGGHVGVRGDVRYYHAFQVLDFVNLPHTPITSLGGTRLDFGRAAAGVVFRF